MVLLKQKCTGWQQNYQFLELRISLKRYKRNTINTDLYRAKGIATNLDKELVIIKRKFLAANYPHRFINSVINTFNEKENKKEESLIPQSFFEIPKPVILTEIPFCVKNEIASKKLIKKFNCFTNYKFDVRIKGWPEKYLFST